MDTESQASSIYMDYAAATPVDGAVLQAMLPFFKDNFYNASATYLLARKAQNSLQQARSTIAQLLGARPSEIIFTAGGSEANNLAIHGVMRQYPLANVVVSGIEHESVLVPAKRYTYHETPVDPTGRVDTNKLAQVIDDNTVLVSIMQANNEVGAIQPLREISQLVRSIRRARQKAGNELPLYLHTDACQAANHLDVHVSRLGADLLTINGSKMYGPKQVGALYVKGGITLQPLIDGGGQERNLRSGTESIAGAVGLATALEAAQTMRHGEAKRLQQVQDLFFSLLTEKLPQAEINGSVKHRLPNNVHITIPGHDNERLLIKLDEAGIMAAAGSACSASSDEPSHVLKAMGLSDSQAQASLRFTMGRMTTEADVRQVVAALQTIVNQ